MTPPKNKSQELISQYGDAAYHYAMHLAAKAVTRGDKEEARLLADSAIELMHDGYHKKPKPDLSK